MSRNHVRAILFFARQIGGKVTMVQIRGALGMSTTLTRNTLAEAVELGFLTVEKFAQSEAIYTDTGKPLAELKEGEQGLIARFEELLAVWGIPMSAPPAQRGRVHIAFS